MLLLVFRLRQRSANLNLLTEIVTVISKLVAILYHLYLGLVPPSVDWMSFEALLWRHLADEMCSMTFTAADSWECAMLFLSTFECRSFTTQWVILPHLTDKLHINTLTITVRMSWLFIRCWRFDRVFSCNVCDDVWQAVETLKSFEKKDSKVATAAATNLSFLYNLVGYAVVDTVIAH